ncbi:PTS lactose/cellobiose transporter subunit IIA [Clostridium amazonitimonense]|uniref:PTS lactose/cellobiose transporter subunit IIA n=1 Tax=Clostridium amazonitimonense TaxID=1499689 RepID=UPI000A764F79|nr:PTS lactose/cellobiose transporter subunit IIA [Clostridium amazonitimonense]
MAKDLMEMEGLIFEIIAHTGEARGYVFDALKAAKEGDFEKAKELMEKSEEESRIAHNVQTKLIQEEINGEGVQINMLLVHAQDQIMTAMSEQYLVAQMIELYKEMRGVK